MMRVHYAPNGSNAWCGRTVGWHTAIPATRHADRVTCRSCLRSMAHQAREGRRAEIVGIMIANAGEVDA
jgi:hypothetical protein